MIRKKLTTVDTTMDDKTFRDFCSLIYEKSGIKLNDSKRALVSARIGKRLRATGCPDPRSYLDYVLNDESGQEMVFLLDAISTNLTSFFREPEHFKWLDKLMREWHQEKGQTRFRIWCAAASTGEEPYNIAMVVLDAVGENTTDTRILATDISTRVLKRAIEGVYTAERVRPIPRDMLNRYFIREKTKTETLYRVKPILRKMLTFRRLNLSKPPFPMKGPLDVVFCRNVMIYFDDPTRERLIAEIERLLKPGGYLMVGHTESLSSIRTRLRRVAPAVYVK